jgi:hypothetical protein
MMRKFKEFILLASALLAVMLMAALLDCGGTGNSQTSVSDEADFEVPFSIDQEKKAEYVMGKVQDWDRGEDLQAGYAFTEADWWTTKTHVQFGFSADTVATSRQGSSTLGLFGNRTKLGRSVMEESRSLYVPLGRSETGDYVYALPCAKVWFE